MPWSRIVKTEALSIDLAMHQLRGKLREMRNEAEAGVRGDDGLTDYNHDFPRRFIARLMRVEFGIDLGDPHDESRYPVWVWEITGCQ